MKPNVSHQREIDGIKKQRFRLEYLVDTLRENTSAYQGTSVKGRKWKMEMDVNGTYLRCSKNMIDVC